MSERLYRRGDSPNWYAYLGKVNGRDVYRSTGCRDREAAAIKAAQMEREAQGLVSDAPLAGEDTWYRRPAASYVYFVQAERTGAIKIGRAADPDARLVRMQTASPVPLRLLAAVPGGPQMETALHALFHDQRRDGEWFESSGRLLAVVRELALVLRRPVVVEGPRRRFGRKPTSRRHFTPQGDRANQGPTE